MQLNLSGTRISRSGLLPSSDAVASAQRSATCPLRLGRHPGGGPMAGKNCPSCSTENPAQARFCLACGTPLALSCASCGEAVPPEARFCMSCGTARRDAWRPGARRQAAPVKPPTPYPTPESPPEERRQVTVLFADLSGYTAVSERLDPEQVEALVDRSLARLQEEVDRYGGRVDKFMGDNVMALFGAPVAHEDDPRAGRPRGPRDAGRHGRDQRADRERPRRLPRAARRHQQRRGARRRRRHQLHGDRGRGERRVAAADRRRARDGRGRRAHLSGDEGRRRVPAPSPAGAQGQVRARPGLAGGRRRARRPWAAGPRASSRRSSGATTS